MLRLLRSELFRLRKRPQCWVLGIVMVGGVASLYAGITIATLMMSDNSGPREALAPENIFSSGMQLVVGAGFILLAIVAASIVGNEFAWGTIRPLVLLASGLVACIACAAVGSLIAGTGGWGTAGMVGDWIVSFLRLLLAQAPYTALAFFVTLLARSTAVGIGVGIGVGILEAALWSVLTLITDAFESIRKLGLDYPSTLFYNLNTGYDDATVAEAWMAAAILTGWTILFVGATYVVFARRDVTSESGSPFGRMLTIFGRRRRQPENGVGAGGAGTA
jgi:ABC-type transport system involved in multi-copper enzyme maturation permease subunit